MLIRLLRRNGWNAVMGAKDVTIATLDADRIVLEATGLDRFGRPVTYQIELSTEEQLALIHEKARRLAPPG